MRRWLLFALLSVAACATAPPPREPAQPVPSPTPPVPSVPTPKPTIEVPPPIHIPNPTGAIRVLLSTPTAKITLPQPGRIYRVEWKGGTTLLHGPLHIASAQDRAWQVGAWSDVEHAARTAARLSAALGSGSKVWRETAPSGLVRVRVVLPPNLPAPRARLNELGFPGALPVDIRRLHLDSADGVLEAEPPVHLVPEGTWPTAVSSRRYHGTFWVALTSAGLHLINQISLESYLRGVVPAEMGPHSFPELEALKAQAVAARTYAVAHLGDHDPEGYDICDTPACQVYRGADAEHSLTNRAVIETEGIIATYQGRPIDAMYTSTCGGHTEEAALLFPDRAQPYLVGVSCSWDRALALTGESDPGDWAGETAFRAEIARRALGTAADDPVAALGRVATLCSGSPPPAAVPADPNGWAETLLAASGLSQAAQLEGVSSTLEQLLRLADRHHVKLPRPEGKDTARWRLATVEGVLELQGLLTSVHGEAVPRPEGPGIYPSGADSSEPLSLPAPLWERWNGSYRPVATASVLPGTRLERVAMDDTTLALVVVRSDGDGEADRRSHWRWWSRERTWSWLEQHLGVGDLERLEITRRSPTGRVIGLRAVGVGGAVKEWTGFDVRQVLELPETLFSFHILTHKGQRVVRFLGRGWGHGVGLCQNGSYGLARAGLTYDRILEHYYTGIQLTHISPGP